MQRVRVRWTAAFLGASLGMPAWPAPWRDRIEYADQLTAMGEARN